MKDLNLITLELQKNNILKSAKTKLGNNIELICKDYSPLTTHNSLIIGVFHGNEPQGKFLIEKYLERFNPLLEIKDFGPPSRGGHQYNSNLIGLCQNLRNNSTKPEIILWQYLKQRQLGVKFRRQSPIGNYIVDFVCFEKKLVIELDGSQHNFDKEIIEDNRRTEFLNNAGFRVLRIWNNDIYENIECVIEYIKNNLCPPLEGGPKSLISRRGDSQRGNLLFIPCLNPDGMQLGTRTNANGVDLNRNFPTQNWGEDGSKAFLHSLENDTNSSKSVKDYFGGELAGSEIETQFVMEVIEEYKPQAILTLHSPYKVVNYDGPAKNLAEKISKVIKYPVEASIGYPTPGSFGTYAGIERQIPTITLELDETCPVEDLIEPVHQVFELLVPNSII